MEQLDHVQLFAGTHELDGFTGGGPDGQSRTAAGVAVQLGEHDAVDAQSLVEGSGCVDGILTGHGVHHQQDLVRMHLRLDVLQLVHQGLVHMEAAGGVQEHHVVAVVPGVFDGLLGNVHGIGLSHLENGNIQLLAHHLQLGDGGGTVYVAGHQQGALAELAAHQARQLGAVGGFTGALKAHHHHHGGTLDKGESLALVPPISCTSSSLTILTICWAGVRLSRTSAPMQRSVTWGHEV